MQKLAYTIDELPDVGGPGRTKAYEAINAGALKAKKRGGRTIVLAPDLKKYLDNLPDYEPAPAAAAYPIRSKPPC